MGKTKREPSRQESFHKHYSAIWGEERWQESLFPALLQPTRHSALVNLALPQANFRSVLEDAGISLEDLESVPMPYGSSAYGQEIREACLTKRLDATVGAQPGASMLLPPPQMSKHPDGNFSLMSHWNMDAASILAAKLLHVEPGDAVLDLCASPGGKSIALAQDLFLSADDKSPTDTESTQKSDSSLLWSNEADKARHRRLAENLKAYLPHHLKVKCTNIDATSPNAHRELAIADGWDKILVDAPCSSERHIIHAHAKAEASGRIAPEMANWRPGSTKRLQETQVKLLMTALRLLKPHGKILYATCSIEPGENDGVVEKTLAQVEKERRRGLVRWAVEVDDLSTTPKGGIGGSLRENLERNWAERTQHGWIVLPDHPSGGRWGPLFFALLTKIPAGG